MKKAVVNTPVVPIYTYINIGYGPDNVAAKKCVHTMGLAPYALSAMSGHSQVQHC